MEHVASGEIFCALTHEATAGVELVVRETQSYKRVDVEEIDHGKLERISSTSLLVIFSEAGPASSTGSPVAGSLKMRTLRGRLIAGVSTIRPASTAASSGSPARMPSLRRRGSGITTWPLVETVVRIWVRQSYRFAAFSSKLIMRRRAALPSCNSTGTTLCNAAERSSEADTSGSLAGQ
jgi:hypothetical protein